MIPLDYWHPVLLSRELGRKPVGVSVVGEEVVLFRTPSGAVGALQDRCLHRRMRLSRGWVEGERLVCPYHGWSFDPAGNGESASTPKMHACAPTFRTVERHGIVWIQSPESARAFPEPPVADFEQLFVLRFEVRAPLELVVDNFAEIEHSCTTHVFLGYDRAGIAETECHVTYEPDSIRILNRGPQRQLHGFGVLERIFRHQSANLFVGDCRVRFDPIRLELENYWSDRETGDRRGEKSLGIAWFNPATPDRTDLFFTALVPRTNPWITRFLFRTAGKKLLEYETGRDIRMVEGIADKDPDIGGMKLSRFDRPLLAIRERLAAEYWRGPRFPRRTCEVGAGGP